MPKNAQIVTAREFSDFIASVIGTYDRIYKGSLEEYLRGLLVSFSKHESKNASYSLFASILEEGFQLTPLPFEVAWLQYTEPPPNRLRQITLEAKSKELGLDLPKLDTNAKGLSDFDCLYRTALFQIAELKRFADKKPEEYGKYAKYATDHKYLGLRSPTGHVWYSWDPFTYLECATAGLTAHAKWTATEFKEGNSWTVLACLLEWGRMYE